MRGFYALIATAAAVIPYSCSHQEAHWEPAERTIENSPLYVAGIIRVIDGDTLIVNGTHVRLKGVDAAERGTELGDRATLGMHMLANGLQGHCDLTGEKTWKRDVGYCYLDSGEEIGLDLNLAIIEYGYALACARYSTKYVGFEDPKLVAKQTRAPYCHMK